MLPSWQNVGGCWRSTAVSLVTCISWGTGTVNRYAILCFPGLLGNTCSIGGYIIQSEKSIPIWLLSKYYMCTRSRYTEHSPNQCNISYPLPHKSYPLSRPSPKQCPRPKMRLDPLRSVQYLVNHQRVKGSLVQSLIRGYLLLGTRWDRSDF